MQFHMAASGCVTPNAILTQGELNIHLSLTDRHMLDLKFVMDLVQSTQAKPLTKSILFAACRTFPRTIESTPT